MHACESVIKRTHSTINKDSIKGQKIHGQSGTMQWHSIMVNSVWENCWLSTLRDREITDTTLRDREIADTTLDIRNQQAILHLKPGTWEHFLSMCVCCWLFSIFCSTHFMDGEHL